MFRNQYLLSNRQVENNLANFRVEKFGNFYLYLEENLDFNRKKFENIEIGFIGIAFNPLKPHSTIEDLLSNSFNSDSTEINFFHFIESLSGRFVGLFRVGNFLIITGDFKHHRKILYSINNEVKFVTSSLKLFYHLSGTNPEFNDEIKAFFESKIFLSKQQDWFGDKTVDNNFKRLLPNHQLDFSTNNIRRIPISIKKIPFEEVLENSFQILRGTYEHINQRYNLIQPITAGWDSRIILGASLPFMKKIKYYIFKRPEMQKSHDVIISQKIADYYSLDFSIYTVGELKDEFLAEYKKNYLILNNYSKLANIQHHYFENKGIEKLINLSGVSGNLFRFIYGATNKKIHQREVLYYFNSYGPSNKLVTNQIDSWYDESVEYAKTHNLSILDLFYIENRLANWGSMYAFEQDMALDEIDPFNNKALMYPVLLLDSKFRGFNKDQLSWKLLEMFETSLCKFPFNPNKGPLHMFIKKNFRTFLMYKKIKFLKSKFLET